MATVHAGRWQVPSSGHPMSPTSSGGQAGWRFFAVCSLTAPGLSCGAADRLQGLHLPGPHLHRLRRSGRHADRSPRRSPSPPTGSSYAKNLTWSGWGSATATGTGTLELDDPQPQLRPRHLHGVPRHGHAIEPRRVRQRRAGLFGDGSQRARLLLPDAILYNRTRAMTSVIQTTSGRYSSGWRAMPAGSRPPSSQPRTVVAIGKQITGPGVRPGRAARPFQDHDVSPRMVNGRSMERPAHRVASVTSVRPAIRSAPIARLRRAAMTLGPFRVLTLDLSSWYRVSRSQ